MEQTTGQPVEQMVGQSAVAEQSSSATIWYIVLAAVVVIGLGLYFVLQPPVTADQAATDTQAPTEQTLPAPTTGNTTADISADLNQIQDSSATLDADATASANEVQSL